MNNFNKRLISNIKLFKNDQDEDVCYSEKYAFMLYVFEKIEGLSSEEVTVCNEEFPLLGVNLDGYYYNEDSNDYNLILSIYDNENDDDSTISNECFNENVDKIVNFIKTIQDIKKCNLPLESLSYEICEDIARKKDSEIIVSIFTNFKVNTDIQKDGIEKIGKINVSFKTYDLVDLEEKFTQLNNEANVLNLEEKFGQAVSAVRISNMPDFDVYMCSFKGSWLSQLYKEDGQRLLEPNVRSYLKKTRKTNAGIMNTVQYDPYCFVSYNNGLTSIATSCEVSFSPSNNDWCTIKEIDNFQIVNGGQTTATLAECSKEKLQNELNDVVVPVKLTVIKNSINSQSLIGNISVYSNTQTAIKKSDPPSNLQYYIDMKKVSNTVTLTNDSGKTFICYFERTAGEYDTELRRNNQTLAFKNKNPKTKKFNKIQLATSINCWQQLPHIVSTGREKNFITFNNVVKNESKRPDDVYFKKAYATIILFRKIDKLCRKMKLSVKSNVVTYTLSYLSYLSNKRIDLIKIFNNQDIDDNLVEIINDIMPKIHTLICNTPENCPEPRMWARKEALWSKVKQLNLHYNFSCCAEETNFFHANESQTFIDTESNFNNYILWQSLSLWNQTNNKLNNYQSNMVKGMIYLTKSQKRVSKKQASWAKDIFMFAVNNGFPYK